ncbi:hypothetical protein NFI96_005949 [Prochilodus magdalenae]|nr:hypothetical protein NFI96_005949 [Prochilodus magdalenae]
MYYIGTGGKDWNQSRQDCRERGSDLVIINSLEEQRFIQELELEVWIGLTKISSTWTWVDGSSLSSGYWITGEPNEYRSGEDCAESKPNHGSLNSWNDERCTTYLNWVCEREAWWLPMPIQIPGSGKRMPRMVRVWKTVLAMAPARRLHECSSRLHPSQSTRSTLGAVTGKLEAMVLANIP